MALIATKIPANIGNSSPVSSGNHGTWNPVKEYRYWVTGTPAAVTAVPIGFTNLPAKCVGVSVGLGTIGSANITVSPLKIPCDGTGTGVALCSTNAVIASTATGPALTSVYKLNGAATAVTKHSAATGITDPVLDETVTFAAGDCIGVTTSGTFTSTAGLCVSVFLQEMNGQ